MKVLVREAIADDVPRIAALFDAYRVFYGQTANPYAAQFFLSERFKRNDSKIFLAVDNDSHQAVGFVQLFATFSSIHFGRMYIVEDIYVREDARRTGIGTALLDAAAIFAKANKAIGLTLQTANTNERAQAFYKRHGFAIETEFVTYNKFFEKT
jgi:ribosomal protein S18 acetylase RimI-like enzyme